MIRYLPSLVILMSAPCTVQGQPWTSHRPDGHAPIGVMGDHTHGAGEMMLSYRFMSMPMDGLRDGTDALEPGAVVDAAGYGFMVTPTKMPMQMHMVGMMWAPTGDLTLMGMIPFIHSEMDHETRAGGEFTTRSSGLGDVKVVGLYTVARPDHRWIIVQLGASLPTGSIDEMDATPASAPAEVRLPYPMQVGSGTFGLLPGITYLGQAVAWSWGGQARAVVRIGKNDNSYRLGNSYDATVWAARRLSGVVSVSGRVLGRTWGNIDGADPLQNPAMVPTARPDLRGGKRLDGSVGFNISIADGPLHGFRIATEFVVPIFQDLDGPQLELDPYFVIGAQYAFDL